MTSFFKQSGYKSSNSGIKADWVGRSDTEPIIDRDDIDYGWIIRSQLPSNITSVMTTSPTGTRVIDQELLAPQREEAMLKLLAFFSKEDSDASRAVLMSNTFVKDVQNSNRPDSPLSFYIAIPAKVFDDVRNAGAYQLTPVDEGDTIYSIVEKYREFFKVTDNTASGSRARLAELFIANNIDLDTTTEEGIKTWIGTVNGNPESTTFFGAGVEIYLPVVMPSEPPTPFAFLSIVLGDLPAMIEDTSRTLSSYQLQIESFEGLLKNLDMAVQIKLLGEFQGALRKHFAFNGLNIKDFDDDSIDLYFNANYELIYMVLDQMGEKIPLTKGMSGLSAQSPFNDATTMKMVSVLSTIKDINAKDFSWQQFVEEYIYPPVVITSPDPNSTYQKLQQKTLSVVDQLGDKFGKTSILTDGMAAQEKATMQNAQMMQAASAQQAQLTHPVGDPVVADLAAISRELGAAGGGQGAIDSTYALVLFRMSIADLVGAAVECLKQQFPITCDVLLGAIFDKNLELGVNTFRFKLPFRYQGIALKARQMAISGNVLSTYTDIESGFSALSPFGRFSRALEYGLAAEGQQYLYDTVFDEVCAIFYDPEAFLKNLFKIPKFWFPDNLPVVDYLADIAKALEAAIIQLLVGTVVKLVQSLIDSITNACGTTDDIYDVNAFGDASIEQALTSKLGTETAAVLGELYDSLGGADTSGLGVGDEAGAPATYMDLQGMSAGSVTEDLANKCSLIMLLLNDLSRVLTPSEIAALFAGTASNLVCETVLSVTRLRHPAMYAKVNTIQGVIDLFAKIEKLADVSVILDKIVTISRGLGCVFESNCLDDILDLPDSRNPLLDLLPPPQLPNTAEIFCQEKGSAVDHGLIPKDNATILHILNQTLDMMYDPVYMAYDAEANRIGDSMAVVEESNRIIPRTLEKSANISFDVFNFFKMSTEKFEIKFPDWFPKDTIMNPEFQRFVTTGFVPPDGDPNGEYGPYTTEKVPGFLGIEYDKILPTVKIPQKKWVFGGNSKEGMKLIKDVKVGSDTGVGNMFFSLSEPYTSKGFKPSTFTVKYTLVPAVQSNEYENLFMLQIGDIPIDPSSLNYAGSAPPSGDIPSLTYSPMSTAIYRTNIFGTVHTDEKIQQVLSLLAQENGGQLTSPGSVPQVEALVAYMRSLYKEANANEIDTEGAIAFDKFSKDRMYSDLIAQMLGNIGAKVLTSPLLKQSMEDNTPYVKLIDWAPLTGDTELGCGFDPHILALDTIKNRVREAYQDYIKCSPFEDEISVDGKGRENLSALEAASMTGCIMTTIRAYALEQLVRAMFPTSVFIGEELISALMVEYVAEETLRGLRNFGGMKYYDVFLDQVELVFSQRMNPTNPFGNIEYILAQSEELGLTWSYAEDALREYRGELTSNDTPQGQAAANAAAQNFAASCPIPDGGDAHTNATAVAAKEQMVYNRLRFLIEEQLYSVIVKLQDLISLDGTLSLDDSLLTRGMPLLDVQKEPGELRLAREFKSLRTIEMEAMNRQYTAYLKEFADWEDGRLGELLGLIATPVIGVAKGIGVTLECLMDALLGGVDAPTADDAWVNPMTFMGDAADAGYNFLTNIPGAIADIPECLETGAQELLDTAVDALAVMIDTPAPLETFAKGADLYATDQLGNIDTFVRGQFQANFTLTDNQGSVILEKYIKVRRPGAYEDPNLAEQPVASSNEQIAGSPFSNVTSNGMNVSQVLCPREKQNTSNRGNVSSPVTTGGSAASGDVVQTSLIPRIDSTVVDYNASTLEYNEQIYNIEKWEEEFATLMANNPNTAFRDHFESWSFGVRLVYVAPTNKFEEIPSTSEIGTAKSELKIPTTPGGDPDVMEVVFNSRKEHASLSYRQFERTVVEKKVAAIDYEFADPSNTSDSIITEDERIAMDETMAAINPAGEPAPLDTLVNLTTTIFSGELQLTPFPARDDMLTFDEMNEQIDTTASFFDVTLERAVYLFPLSEVEIPLVISENTPLNSVMGILKQTSASPADPNFNLNKLWQTDFMANLMVNMKSSPGYRFAFKYAVPSETLLSFSAIYAALLSELRPDFFDGTKAELKKLLELLLNGGDYTFKTDDEIKKGGNREQYAYAQANVGTDGTARRPSLFDMAIQTPKLIFKGLTEFIDPVIAPAAAIVKAGKGGLLLPKFLKKADSDGIETDEQLKVSVTVGPYDLPPPMGKFPNPWDDEETYDGLSQDPAENISFEFGVFDFNDIVTGQSLAPFLRGFYEEQEGDYEFSLALVKFDMETIMNKVVQSYAEKANADPCGAGVVQDAQGNPVAIVPTLVYPGDKLDLPVTPIAMATLPMDVMGGFGIGPPHTPLGWIYHLLVAAEGANSISFPTAEEKARKRRKEGFENKKNPNQKGSERLCIDVDLIRDEENKRRT